MEQNTNTTWEPEMKQAPGLPADERQTEEMQDSTTPENEDPLPAYEDVEEEGLDGEGFEEGVEKQENSDDDALPDGDEFDEDEVGDDDVEDNEDDGENEGKVF